ncbi:hypothetical protein KPLM21_690004 [Klebsiella pneumoniae]|nr:hypothetical protein [Klebsiella pneumoniae ISC21]CED76001.1 hypothetical protein KPLM21_690004 [Klebsiella pneumoniae]
MPDLNACERPREIACAAALGHATFDSRTPKTHHNGALMNDFSACLVAHS